MDLDAIAEDGEAEDEETTFAACRQEAQHEEAKRIELDNIADETLEQKMAALRLRAAEAKSQTAQLSPRNEQGRGRRG